MRPAINLQILHDCSQNVSWEKAFNDHIPKSYTKQRVAKKQLPRFHSQQINLMKNMMEPEIDILIHELQNT